MSLIASTFSMSGGSVASICLSDAGARTDLLGQADEIFEEVFVSWNQAESGHRTSGKRAIVPRGGQAAERPLGEAIRGNCPQILHLYGCDRLALHLDRCRAECSPKEDADVKPMAAALTGALVAGVGMYAIGTQAQDRLAVGPGLAGNPAISYFASTPQPMAQPVANRRRRRRSITRRPRSRSCARSPRLGRPSIAARNRRSCRGRWTRNLSGPRPRPRSSSAARPHRAPVSADCSVARRVHWWVQHSAAAQLRYTKPLAANRRDREPHTPGPFLYHEGRFAADTKITRMTKIEFTSCASWVREGHLRGSK